MKIQRNILSFVIGLAAAVLPATPVLADNPTVAFLWPAHGQSITNLTGLSGIAASTNSVIQTVTFKLREVDIHGGPGRWWNGTNFQNTMFNLPTDLAATNWTPSASLLLPALNPGQSYELAATASDDVVASISSSITVNVPVTGLSWDPGDLAEGTAPLANPNTNGGNYHFEITTENPAVGVWRTALKVFSGEANLYLRNGSPPATNSASYESERAGSDGVVLHSSQFGVNQSWYLLVTASPGAEWTLLTGDAFVHDLGPLAADASSSTNVAIGPEGMVFFQTTVPANTLAWRLWASGATNTIYVRKSLAPHPSSYDLIQARAMLVVSPYLNAETFNGSYFVGIPGDPGAAINLDSRQHIVTDWAFDTGLPSTIIVTTNDFPFLTYRVQVPVEQIAWENSLTPSAGNPNLAVRRDLVPNEFRNDAFSDVGGLVGDSLTLVPATSGTAGLSDGTYYVTVYGSTSFTSALTNRNPVITTVPFEFQITNDAPDRVGWRYYKVTDTNQLGKLGWNLLLSNAPPGTEIALRRNQVPGRWRYRNADNVFSQGDLGFVDYSGTGGFLQRPGHQFDVWYIGVYHPDSGLGAFQLTGQELLGAPLAFDGTGSTTNVSNRLPDRWEFFRVDVPADSSLLGWDVRLQDVSGGGGPQMVVRRGSLPGSVTTTGWPNDYWDGLTIYPWLATNWPSGFQWAAGADWTGYSSTPDGQPAHPQTLTMGMGNPLQPGTYYVGIYNAGPGTTSYTLVSRAIGTNGQSIAVRDLDFVGSTNSSGLLPREAAYYRVVVPNEVPSWQIKLTPTVGEALLVAHKGWIPNSGAQFNSGWLYNYESYPSYAPTRPIGGRMQKKAGHEHLAVLPYYYYETNLPPGEYYLAVVSEGVNPDSYYSRIGSNTVSYTLSSLGPVETNYPSASGPTNQVQEVGAADLVFTNAQEFGEYLLYQFAVPTNVLNVEVRLENREGNPWMGLKQTERLVAGNWYEPACGAYYGDVNGEPGTWNNGSVITLASPASGLYTLAVATRKTPYVNVPPYGCQSADVGYIVRARVPEIPNLSFSPELNTNGFTNVLGGILADNQRAFFRVEVPASVSNAPVLGWKLDLAQASGAPSVRVRKNMLPDDLNSAETTPFVAGSVTIVPAYLSPGTWYVEVKGGGNTDFTLTSSVITTNTLARSLWVMPAAGESTVAPGLSLPVFGDTSIAADGAPLPGDSGVDLEQGGVHYYAIVVPSNNAGLLRAELQALSGNPDLYLRAGAAPTLSHYANGGSGSVLYDRSLTAAANSEYGNWVPLDGRFERELTNGVWVIAVHAAGNSNCRYRLKLSCGNPVAGGLVQELVLGGAGYSGQLLAGRDWRYYRFSVDSNYFGSFSVTFSRSQGGGRLFIRDSAPPGDATTTYTQDYYNETYQYQRDWYSDDKNQGPYPLFASPDTHQLAVPPLRPGHTYYLGFWSPDDTTFSVSATSDSNSVAVVDREIAFYGGGVTNVSLPGNASRLYRVTVPASATRWKHYTTNASTIVTAIEQGTLPLADGPAHWRSSGADTSLNQPLSPSSWPWQPAQVYYLLVTNISGTPQVFTLRLDGRNAATEDEDNDDLPDVWENAYFGNTWQYNGNSDPDGDGVSNYHELLNGSSPVVADTFSLAQPTRLGNGDFQFLFVGPNNGRYQAQYRSDLAAGAWTAWLNFTNVGGSTIITDTNTAADSQRFYRAVSSP